MILMSLREMLLQRLRAQIKALQNTRIKLKRSISSIILRAIFAATATADKALALNDAKLCI